MSVDFAVFNKRVLHKKLQFYVNMEKYVFLSNIILSKENLPN